MQNVLLVIHMVACVALVIAVMLQRSEGGALGMSGGGTGGMISGRGAAGVLVRTTMVLAAIFFTTSITMTWLNAQNQRAPTDVERETQGQTGDPLGALGAPPAGTPSVTTPVVPSTPDPLAPATTPPVGSTTTPTPAPVTPAPTTPAVDPLAPARPPAATTTPSTTPATPPATPPGQ
jgi:preprotein translocase subunit SecG